MRLLRRCAIAAAIVSTVAALGAVLTFNGPLAMLTWPGIIVMNKLLARFEIYAGGSNNLLPWLLPGFLIDIAVYTLAFFLLATMWRTLVPKSNIGIEASRMNERPTKSDQRRAP